MSKRFRKTKRFHALFAHSFAFFILSLLIFLPSC